MPPNPISPTSTLLCQGFHPRPRKSNHLATFMLYLVKPLVASSWLGHRLHNPIHPSCPATGKRPKRPPTRLGKLHNSRRENPLNEKRSPTMEIFGRPRSPYCPRGALVEGRMDCWCVHVFICSFDMRDPGRDPSLRLPSARQIDASDGSSRTYKSSKSSGTGTGSAG